jgi:4-amino-4-deoxy-L-arabinose transferase-like glycosyltransferase
MASELENRIVPHGRIQGVVLRVEAAAAALPRWFWLLLCFFVVRGLLWSALIPPFQGPDEQVHFAGVYDFYINNSNPWSANRGYDQRTAAFGNLSEFEYQRFRPENRREFRFESTLGPNEEAIRNLPPDLGPRWETNIIVQHPPFYYLFASFILRVLPSQNPIIQLYSLRAFSVFLGALALLFVYLATRELVTDNARWQSYVVIFLAFIPMMTFICSVVNPDAYAHFGGALFFWAFFRWIQRREERSAVYWLTFSLLIITTTKKSMYFVFPHVVCVLVLVILMERRIFWTEVLLLFLACLVFVGFYTQYPGFREYTILTEMKFRGLAIRPVDWGEIDYSRITRTILWGDLAEYWGVFGWGDGRYPEALYKAFRVLTYVSMASIAGVVLFRKDPAVPRLQLLLLLGYAILVFVGVWAVNVGLMHSAGKMYAHGRHLLSAWFPHAVFVVVGMPFLLMGRRGEWLAQGLCAVMVVIDTAGLLLIIVPRYSL